MQTDKLKRIIEYIWTGIVLIIGYTFFKDKGLWMLFLLTFLVAGAGTLLINLFFILWKRKQKRQNN
ncbi:hypothetical protein ACFDTO_29810 [Microbacteriaceae bacterium 4G12]